MLQSDLSIWSTYLNMSPYFFLYFLTVATSIPGVLPTKGITIGPAEWHEEQGYGSVYREKETEKSQCVEWAWILI